MTEINGTIRCACAMEKATEKKWKSVGSTDNGQRTIDIRGSLNRHFIHLSKKREEKKKQEAIEAWFESLNNFHCVYFDGRP